MKKVSKSVMLDETGRRIAEGLKTLSSVMSMREGRVMSLSTTDLATGIVLEVIGIPDYVEDVTQYAEYGITETGWYLFSRITAKEGILVTEETTVEGAAGFVAVAGEDHVDVAVRFGVTAETQEVLINWGATEETFIFKATDLAIRNLDRQVTFYVYDLADYAIWSYALTADTTFTAGKKYFTLQNEEYVEAEVTAGAAVTENTYYEHSKLRIEGMVRNVTYKLDEPVSFPIEIALPEIADDGHGAWFEFQFYHTAATSITMIPLTEGVKVNTAGASAAITAGVNVVDLHYTKFDSGAKLWTLANVHTNIPT